MLNGSDERLMNYKISTIFYSVQGEGYFCGEAGIFLRFYACDLDCKFCDDELHKATFTMMDSSEILREFAKYPAKKVIITGGEPTLYELNSLILEIKNAGYFVCIETNGFALENVREADWITYSPKDLNRILPQGFDEIKILVDKHTNIKKALEFQTDKPKFFQPINYFHEPNFENLKRCVELVKANPSFKLSTQLHKLLGVE